MFARLHAAIAGCLLWITAPMIAGTVVNLGPTSAVINISGTQDGAAVYNLHQTLWYQPFNTGANLLEYTVQAGTYSFALVNNDKSSPFFNASATYEAWTYNSPWITNYLVFDVSAATNPNESQLLYLASSPSVAPDAASAFNMAVTGGYRTATHTFYAPETLIFVVPDNLLADNTGGVSVLVSKGNVAATPEPASVLLVGLAASLAFAVRKVRSRCL